MKKAASAILGFLFIAVCGAWSADKVPGDVVALFHKRCAVCHKGKTPPQGLSWEPTHIAEAIDRPSREAPELKIIDSASPEASYILKKVRRESDIKGKPMPPLKALGDKELQLLEAWILGLKRLPVPLPVSAVGGPANGTFAAGLSAQDEAAPDRAFDTPVFFGTRLLNLPTTTTPDKGDFLVRIAHRFSDRVEEGFDDLLGLDSYANIFLGVGYGITDNLAVSIGRARFDKEFELAADWLVAGQSKASGFPISIALHGGVDLVTESIPDEAKLFAMVSLSRQLTRRLSVLVVPAFVTNANHWDLSPESTFSLGLGARYMIFKEFSIIAEWVPVLAGYGDVEGGWGLGFEKKIGGHVFQIFINNALGLTAAQVLPGGDYRLGDFDFRIGFTIFRTF
jgi:hypothetical protein